jgi:hypothetical protein
LHGVFSGSVVYDLSLADLLSEVTLQQDQPDKHVWSLSMSGKFSTKSAYEASFQGSISFEAYDCIWKSWAPPKCAFFLWLVAHNRCWMADMLQRRQFWYYLLRRVELAALAPHPTEPSFIEWWRRISSSVSNATAKGLNFVTIPRHLDIAVA